jgi:hypothetical protein
LRLGTVGVRSLGQVHLRLGEEWARIGLVQLRLVDTVRLSTVEVRYS